MNTRQCLRGLLAAVVLGVALTLGPARVEAAEPPGDALARACELGITLALSGEDAAAESTFIGMLYRSPGDPRALNNLGNIHLRRGDPELALSFYGRAGVVDTADAGILLNQATALMLTGQDTEAGVRAGEGVRRAGGVKPAADLLGLSLEDMNSSARAADRARMSREEIFALLRKAAKAVPVDTLRTASPDSGAAIPARRGPTWRPAGARGSAESQLDVSVYWKR